MVDPTPDELAARYDGVLRHGATFELEADAFERAKRRADRWGVGAFVGHEGRVLLVEQGGTWYLPGGIREAGESLESGARRELREETGLDVEIDGLAAISEQTFRHGEETVAFHFATFEATPNGVRLSDDPGRPGEGIEAAAWRFSIPENTFDRGLVSRLSERYTPEVEG